MEFVAAFSTFHMNICFWSQVTHLDDQNFTSWLKLGFCIYAERRVKRQARAKAHCIEST